jgi:hypothetical protein
MRDNNWMQLTGSADVRGSAEDEVMGSTSVPATTPRPQVPYAAALRTVAAGLTILAACGPSRQQIDDIISRAQPLVQAVHRYEKERGRPPARLGDLVPKYISAIPATGLPTYREFLYTVHEASGRWGLSVKLERLGFKHIDYSPSGSHNIPVTPLRDGWVLVNP